MSQDCHGLSWDMSRDIIELNGRFYIFVCVSRTVHTVKYVILILHAHSPTHQQLMHSNNTM